MISVDGFEGVMMEMYSGGETVVVSRRCAGDDASRDDVAFSVCHAGTKRPHDDDADAIKSRQHPPSTAQVEITTWCKSVYQV